MDGKATNFRGDKPLSGYIAILLAQPSKYRHVLMLYSSRKWQRKERRRKSGLAQYASRAATNCVRRRFGMRKALPTIIPPDTRQYKRKLFSWASRSRIHDIFAESHDAPGRNHRWPTKRDIMEERLITAAALHRIGVCASSQNGQRSFSAEAGENKIPWKSREIHIYLIACQSLNPNALRWE